MPPVTTKASTVIDAPAEAAWAVLGDYANDPLWRSAVARMEQTPPGPVHDGATAVEELHTFGRTVVTRIELHDVRPGAGFAWRAIDGTDAHGTRTVVSLGADRCEVRTHREIGLRGADRLLQPIVAWSMARAEREDLRRAAVLVVERAAAGAIG